MSAIDVRVGATVTGSSVTLEDALGRLDVPPTSECRACLARLQSGPSDNVDIARCVKLILAPFCDALLMSGASLP